MKLNFKKKADAGEQKITRKTKMLPKAQLKEGKETVKDKRIAAMQAARQAKASGKAPKKSHKKPAAFTWKAPEALGPSFTTEVSFLTEKDGMPGGKWKILRFKGKYPNEDERKIFNLAVTDPTTYAGIISRISFVLFHPTGRLNSKGQSPRLEPKTQYRLTLRCARRKKDDVLVARFAKAWVIEKNKKGKLVPRELDKKDPARRKFMKVNKHLAAAFSRLAELPVTRKRRASDDADEE